MAGGKETPRQRLIGLMYIVFLAMLALQVDSAILEKFQYLSQSLETAYQDAVARNTQTTESIQSSVQERGNKPGEVVTLKSAQEVRQRTSALITEIEAIKNELIERSGGKDSDGRLAGAKDADAVANLMIGPGERKNGKAYALKSDLNDFTAYLNQVASTSLPLLALDGKDDPVVKNDPRQRNKDFAILNFESTPLVAALAVLSDKQAKIANYEAQVLNELASKVGAADFKFDKLFPMARAESRVVAAGTEYVADLFISAASSSIKPTMKFQGKDLPVDPNGVGQIKFRASASNYDAEGNSKQTWKAQITMPNPIGGDTTFTHEEEYIVAKPVMQIQSASVQALYMNCGNDLDVQVPALGVTYQPAFSVSGGSQLAGAKKGQVIVIPNSKKVTLNVSSGGNAIGSQEFSVRSVPKPTLVAYVGNRPANTKVGEPATGLRSLILRAEPDADFAAQLPKEARYAVTEAEVILARGSRPLKSVTATNPNVNLAGMIDMAQKGDRIVIDVKKVVRKNFRDQIEEVSIPGAASIINIQLN